MKLKSLWSALAISAALLVSSTAAMAASYMPFILGSTTSDSVEAAADKAKSALTANGFQVVGSYSPTSDVQIVVVTNDALKALAAQSKNGAFGAMERVAIVKRGGNTEVSYTNPTYMWNVYKMKGDIAPIQAAMEKALGNQSTFGADEALSEGNLRDYHYKFMMPYFDDVDELEDYDSHQQAVDTIEKALAAGKAGVTKVYRIDIPEAKSTVFGVAIAKGEGADKNILSQIDGSGHSHAAHLPYEILVVGDKAIALNGKFRIAINWPSLSMMGSGSFMSIANAPDEIRDALEKVADK